MSISKFLVKLVGAAALAAILTVPLSGDDFISVETWVSLTGLVLAAQLLYHAFKSARIEPASISTVWTWQPKPKRKRSAAVHPARELRSMKGSIASAQFNPRSFTNRLRPRLEELANHFLPLQRAVDPIEDPARTAVVLGDVAWLLDHQVTDRAPTLEELNRFFDIVIGESS